LLEALAPALARGEPYSLRALIRRLCTQHTALGVLSAAAPHLSRPLEVHSLLEFVKLGFTPMNRRVGLLALLPHCTDAQQCEVLDTLLAGPIGLRSQIPAFALESLGSFAKLHLSGLLHDVAENPESPGPAEAAAFAVGPPDLVEILRGGANHSGSGEKATEGGSSANHPAHRAHRNQPADPSQLAKLESHADRLQWFDQMAPELAEAPRRQAGEDLLRLATPDQLPGALMVVATRMQSPLPASWLDRVERIDDMSARLRVLAALAPKMEQTARLQAYEILRRLIDETRRVDRGAVLTITLQMAGLIAVLGGDVGLRDCGRAVADAGEMWP
jgi:hypothetical protein